MKVLHKLAPNPITIVKEYRWPYATPNKLYNANRSTFWLTRDDKLPLLKISFVLFKSNVLSWWEFVK